MNTPIIAVIGGGSCTPEMAEKAREVGRRIANKKGILICGGMAGVMQAACQGAKEAGGLTIGILPGTSRSDANPYVDIPIVTGMADARNVIIIRSAHAAIAVDGEFGTLSEIAYCLQFGIPVISLKSWDIPGVIKVETVEEAVKKAKELLI